MICRHSGGSLSFYRQIHVVNDEVHLDPASQAPVAEPGKCFRVGIRRAHVRPTRKYGGRLDDSRIGSKPAHEFRIAESRILSPYFFLNFTKNRFECILSQKELSNET